MNWITPLGFLGLLGLIILILIYILKPNYQQKIISSTHVWKLSLKYKRKKLPINRFRNILILICQILIISLCASILAQPVVKAEVPEEFPEKIAIIDASASMRASYQYETRFERAIKEVKTLAAQTTAQGGMITVILATTKATVLVQRAGADMLVELNDTLNDLVDLGVEPLNDISCSYGEADVDGAMALAETVLAENAKAEVIFYTATNYIYKGNVTIKNVGNENEWNVAVLNASAALQDNYYVFSIDISCYGADKDITLFCDIYNANYEKVPRNYLTPVRCEDGVTKTVIFSPFALTEELDPEKFVYVQIDSTSGLTYSFDYARIYVAEDDSFSYDNTFYLYGGRQETLKIQYASGDPNPFFGATLLGLESVVRARWDIDYKELKRGAQPALEGFDFYIFENTIPEKLPVDGIVLIMDPDRFPGDSGLSLGEEVQGEFSLTPGDPHFVTENLDPETIHVNKYKRIVSYEGFEPLLYVNGDPALLVKNEVSCKIAVLPFSFAWSDLSVNINFPQLLLNMFNYFIPSTLTDYVFDINESVSLNARGPILNYSGPSGDGAFESFPGELIPTNPGVHTLTQTILSGEEISEYFFAKIPSSQSNIKRQEDELTNPYIEKKTEPMDNDLLIYFASVLVGLLFVEWLLQAREQF